MEERPRETEQVVGEMYALDAPSCREVGHLLGRMRVAQTVKNPPAVQEAQV